MEKTHKPVENYCKLSDGIGNREVFVLEPMLAAGRSAIMAMDFLNEHGCRHITMMDIIGCPEDVAAF